jgi:hypothetical protein
MSGKIPNNLKDWQHSYQNLLRARHCGGGEDFRQVLVTIANQKGFRTVELLSSTPVVRTKQSNSQEAYGYSRAYRMIKGDLGSRRAKGKALDSGAGFCAVETA